LPNRKSSSTYKEKAFIEAYNQGMSGYKLAAKFKMGQQTVALKNKELGLSARDAKIPGSTNRGQIVRNSANRA
jgi:hypothetical protein